MLFLILSKYQVHFIDYFLIFQFDSFYIAIYIDLYLVILIHRSSSKLNRYDNCFRLTGYLKKIRCFGNYVITIPGSIVTDNRIFSRNFTVYEEIRHENGPYSAVILVIVIRHRICTAYGRMHAVFSLQTLAKHRPGLW